MGPWQTNHSVSFGALTTARQFDALNLRTLAEQVIGLHIAVVNQEAREMREGKRIHVENLDTSRSVCMVRIPNVWETLAAHHHRPTPPCCIQALGRSKQGGRTVALVLVQKAIIVEHLHAIAKLHARPTIPESRDRPPRDIFGVVDEVTRPHGLAIIGTAFHSRPHELRLLVLWEEDDDSAHVGSRARCGAEGLEEFAHAPMHRQISLLTFGRAVAGVLAVGAWRGCDVCASRADLGCCRYRCHDIDWCR
jgi:hypothetical protein